MSKKLKGNGLFESSRMMLPEHKEAYLKHQQQVKKKVRPMLDPQEEEAIFRILVQSMTTGGPVTLVLFDEYEERRFTGQVIKINAQQRRIYVLSGTGSEWISFGSIVGASD